MLRGTNNKSGGETAVGLSDIEDFFLYSRDFCSCQSQSFSTTLNDLRLDFILLVHLKLVR